MAKRLLFVNIVLSLLVFIRLYFSDNLISFDRQHYVQFINEISNLSFFEFLNRLIADFPYFNWAEYGAFESGFAVLVYLVSRIYQSTTVWSIIAASSLFIKLHCLTNSNVKPIIVYLCAIFSIILFESNALRAGIAVSIIMIGLCFYYKNSNLKAVIFWGFACLFHLSSFAVIFFIYFGFAFAKIRYSKPIIFMLLIVISFSAIIFEYVGQYMPGKLSEYFIQAHVYDVYTGSSGLNFSSLLCLVLCMSFYRKYCLYYGYKLMLIEIRLSYIGVVMSGSVLGLILFSGNMAIIGDRIFQMVLLLMIMLYYKLYSRIDEKLIDKIINATFMVLLIIYVFVNLLFRYPQSNFFYPITPYVELTPPMLY